MIAANLTVVDVMRLLGISRTKVYELCLAGELRHAKIGRTYRFAPDWVEDYLASVTAGGPGERQPVCEGAD